MLGGPVIFCLLDSLRAIAMKVPPQIFFKNLLDIMGCSIMVVGSRALQTRQKSVTGGKLVCPHNKPRFDFSPLCVVSNAALFPAITS